MKFFSWIKELFIPPPVSRDDEVHSVILQHHQTTSGSWDNSELVFTFTGPKDRATTLKRGIESLLGKDERSMEPMATQELNRGELTMGLAKADVLVEQIQAEVEKDTPSTTYLSTHLSALRRHLDNLVGCVNQ